MYAAPLAATKSPLEIARASGSNFLVSFAFLSPGRRRALLAVYAFCRVADDAVDLAAGDPHQAEEHLAFWENELAAAFDGEPQTPVGYALGQAANRFGLDRTPLEDVCRGVRMDLVPRTYATFDELRVYMARVASAVGIACLPVFGADPERSRPYADTLGVALQYTNMLRDLAEDGDAGRCYLPLDALDAHGVEPSQLTSHVAAEHLSDDGPVASLLRAEHARCAQLFEDAAHCLPAADRRALRPARIMGSIYRDLLRRVERLGPRLLTSPRVRVPCYRKIYLALFGI